MLGSSTFVILQPAYTFKNTVHILGSLALNAGTPSFPKYFMHTYCVAGAGLSTRDTAEDMSTRAVTQP